MRGLHRRSPRALLIVPMFVLVALSGCLGGDDDTTGGGSDASSDCEAGEGVLEIHVLPDAGLNTSTAWYEPANPDLTGYDTVCWVNDDWMWHRIIASPGTLDLTPAWAATAKESGAGGHDHGAGGHDDHGDEGSAPHEHTSDLVFDVEFDAGERLAMPIPEGVYGQLDVHCHPHPWMVSTWYSAPNETRSYPVEVGTLAFKGLLAGVNVTVGTDAQTKFDIPAPNVRKVTAKVEWDDSDDDMQNTGETLNKKDTVKVEIKDPAGTVVVEKTSDTGVIVIDQVFNGTWPASVEGAGQKAAAVKLATDRPDDVTGQGDWTVVVTLVSAPGPIPDKEGTTKAVQEKTDGKEMFTVTFTTVHDFGKVLAEGAAPVTGAPPVATVDIEPAA